MRFLDSIMHGIRMDEAPKIMTPGDLPNVSKRMYTPDNMPQLSGYWIMPDGSMTQMDYRTGIHHGHVGYNAFKDAIRQKWGRMSSEENLNSATEHALDSGWIKVNEWTPSGPDEKHTISVELFMGRPSSVALKALLRYLGSVRHADTFSLEAYNPADQQTKRLYDEDYTRYVRNLRAAVTKIQEATNEYGGRNMSVREKIKLMQKYGGKLVTFAQMPQPYQLAIAHYMAVDGEAWEVPHTQKQMTGYNAEEAPKLLVRDLPRLIKQYGNMKFWIAGVPTKMVDAAIRGIYPDYGFANRPTTGRYGEIHPTTNRWPAIVSSEDGEFLQDGNHRFAQYRTRGDETIPLVMYAR